MNDLDSIRRFYDDEYYAGRAGGGPLPWHCRLIGRRLGSMSGRRVLDVACGTGDWLGHFLSRGARITGVDISSRAIDVCRERFPDCEFHCGPAESLPFSEDSFDLVICMGSLEHFFDKKRALAEMRRVAASEARFVLLVPNAGFLTRRLGFYRGTEQVKLREDVLTLRVWQRLFEEAGLQVLARWRDLHPLSPSWICRGGAHAWPIRAAQALALTTWPLRWQYQVYHLCCAADD